MKILALDLGDRWTGIAIADPFLITAQPFTTIASSELVKQLQEIINNQNITRIVLGLPTTLRGTESEQTKKIKATGEQLKKQFPQIEWVWWDERLTSKQAAHLVRPKNKKDKLATHAVAAAFLLQGYIEFIRQQMNE